MKSKNLHTIKSTGYKTPDDYFEALEDAVFSKLNEERIASKVGSHGFKVPDNYFETLGSEILTVLNEKKSTKIISMFSWKTVASVSGIAASFILAFNLLYSNQNGLTFDDLETASIENYLMNEDMNAYDIAPYFNAEEMNSEDFVENTINASDIEDYLLQNSDVEHLITD
ncbi:MAG: hypothetical protein R2797_06765 [Gelidibacter sp.]